MAALDGVVSDVRGAVTLRAWAMAVLGGHRPSACPEVSPEGWALFLEGERCALPLLRCLERDRDAGGPTERALRQLGERAQSEFARVQSAGRHLQAIGAIGRRRGFPIVVVKGAAVAYDPVGAVDLEDVDVLVEPGHASLLTEGLTRVGYGTGSGGSGRHRPGMSNGDLLKVEVHFALDLAGRFDPNVWSGIRPWSGRDGLWMLAPTDHAWFLLTHVVIEHPNRRSNIRELLLLRSQLLRSPEVIGAVEQLVTAHSEREDLEVVLHEASTLDQRSAPSQRLARAAAATYAVHYVLRRWALPKALTQWSYHTAFALLLGSAARRGVVRRLMVGRGRSQYAWLARLEDRLPRLGMGVRLVGRFAAALASLLVALPVCVLAIIVRRRVF